MLFLWGYTGQICEAPIARRSRPWRLRPRECVRRAGPFRPETGRSALGLGSAGARPQDAPEVEPRGGWGLAIVVATGACWCGEATTDAVLPEAVAAVEEVPREPGPIELAPAHVVVHQASELAEMDLAQVRELDLALSDID